MLLSACECGEKALAYLADNGEDWIVSCANAPTGKCNAKVQASTMDEAVRRWNEVEYFVPASPRVKTQDCPADIPPHWFDVFTEPGRHNQLEACCRRTDNKEIEALRSNSRQWAPDIYIMHCTCGRQHRRFCVGGTGTHPLTGVEHTRPSWECR